LSDQTNVVFGVRISFLVATYTADVGDEIVTIDSALAGDTEHVGKGLADCSISVLEIPRSGNPCYHGHLMTNLDQFHRRGVTPSLSVRVSAALDFAFCASLRAEGDESPVRQRRSDRECGALSDRAI